MLVVNLEKWKSLSKEQQELLNSQTKSLETDGAAVLVKRAKEDDAKLKAAGVEDMELTGAVRDAYLRTIFRGQVGAE